jgi:DsbC/DsbD-like thiol-disulfide interchange protein
MTRALSRRASVLACLAGLLALLTLSAAITATRAEEPRKKPESSRVKLEASATKPDADGKQVLTLTLEIQPGWHIYANPVGREAFEKEATTIKASIGGKAVDLKVDYPPGKVALDDEGNYRVYEKTVTIKGTLQRDKGDTRPVKVTVGFQSCNDKKCLPHMEIEREVP